MERSLIHNVVPLLCALYVLTVSGTAGYARVQGRADLQFESRQYDFGFAGQNRDVICPFAFSNAGTEPLVIKAVKSSCACLVSLSTSGKVDPGGRGAIKVVCKTGKRIGQITEIIRVQSNDPDEPEIQLKIRGVVKAEFALDPEFLSLGDVERGAPVSKVLRLINLGSSRLKTPRVEVAGKYFSSEVAQYDEGPLKGFLIQVVLKPDAPVGRFALPLTLHTDLPRHPRIDVPITGNILGRIRANPGSLLLGQTTGDALSKMRVRVTTVDRTDFKVSSVSVTPPVLLAEWQHDETGGGYEVVLRVSDRLRTGPFAAKLTIRTNDREQPEIEVPVRGTLVEPSQKATLLTADAPAAGSSDGPHVFITRFPEEEDTYLAAWLIKRFLDTDAAFKFVRSEDPEPKEPGTVFDLPQARARWRRTQKGCTSEQIAAEIKQRGPVVDRLIAYVRQLERASWMVSPNSEAGRFHSWVLRLNDEVADPQLRLQKAFAYLDGICEAGGRIPP